MFPLHVYQNRRDQLKAMMPENSLAIYRRRVNRFVTEMRNIHSVGRVIFGI